MGFKFCSKDKKCIITIIAIILTGIISLILMRNIIVFVGFLLINVFLNYYQGKTEFPFDLTPSLVLMIIFSVKLGFVYGLVFLFLGSVIPSVVAAGFNHMTFLFVSLAIVVSYLGSLGITNNLILYGLGLILFQSVIAFFIAKFFSDDPMTLFSVFLGFFVNIVYLLILSGIIGKILV
ncbi:MAG: hypothetical protein COY38_02985 [Candidatus Aenigmarchaeota archaeon CG_4_10_14_0_8_um_filter_37_24]|nr:hypothetical protein [Candidatus Aenigmarchaeota archaeon]OIN88600.1 MAG: hypothetical protein AUJ50_00415 [Candidatus Aenigmarchaeota archaeon CG1_02_38_14]PIV67985.1 MAG: hypothetical protein COS07_05620 [Candidatus Aenigmarchaeota archaeon CG01_land_8_20_14_3_00_37_9]PIW41653.1 MAG: hypothetical protein COW21_00775 [Candidatus Aenigmarchaeota archaeon CG15_BIG_FIL_POST_REV_8_21_14_020_37_27]PIX50724.1 MAG: hypothetical protein COZ52_02620 [Candidatus Aenigmarchaeota archaeon CG_4_8_14_3_u